MNQDRTEVLVVGAGPVGLVLPDPEGLVAERYGTGLVLVRPDGYVGLRAGLGDDGAVASYLRLIA